MDHECPHVQSSRTIGTVNDGFPNGTKFEYKLATDAYLQNVVWESGITSGFVEIARDVVSDKTAYYWNVKITAPAVPGGQVFSRDITSVITVDSDSSSDAGEQADWADWADDGPDSTATNPSEPNEDLYYAATAAAARLRAARV